MVIRPFFILIFLGGGRDTAYTSLPDHNKQLGALNALQVAYADQFLGLGFRGYVSWFVYVLRGKGGGVAEGFRPSTALHTHPCLASQKYNFAS